MLLLLPEARRKTRRQLCRDGRDESDYFDHYPLMIMEMIRDSELLPIK